MPTATDGACEGHNFENVTIVKTFRGPAGPSQLDLPLWPRTLRTTAPGPDLDLLWTRRERIQLQIGSNQVLGDVFGGGRGQRGTSGWDGPVGPPESLDTIGGFLAIEGFHSSYFYSKVPDDLVLIWKSEGCCRPAPTQRMMHPDEGALRWSVAEVPCELEIFSR